jgi:hypothetical protein
MSGPERDEMRGDWRKLHIEECHNLYCPQNSMRMIKSKRMRLSEHIAHMGEKCIFSPLAA